MPQPLARLLPALALGLALVGCVPPGQVNPPPPPPPPPPPDGPGRWASSANLPVAVAEASAASVGGKLYLVSKNPDQSKPGNTWVFDKAMSAWSPLGSTPANLDHTTLVSVGSNVYMAGGLENWAPFDGTKANLWVLDTTKPGANWTDTGKSLPYPRGAHAAVAVGSKVFVFGGIGRPAGEAARDIADALFIDTANLAAGWQTLAPLSVARDHLTAQAVGGKIYVIGGRATNNLCCDFNGVKGEVDVYDAATGAKLANAASLPKPRGGLASAVVGGQVVVFGGEGKVDGAAVNDVFNLTQIFDPAKNEWREGTAMPTARHGIAAAVLGTQAHAVGGGLRLGGGADTNKNETFELP